ncbi:MAG: LamG domain-containing protein [Polyangiaceae bacterium]|nr:LamG domain-containing protein [Polyangiaceae bacterium]
MKNFSLILFLLLPLACDNSPSSAGDEERFKSTDCEEEQERQGQNFNGSGQYINAPIHPDYPRDAAEITLSAWVQLPKEQSARWPTFISNREGTSKGILFGLNSSYTGYDALPGTPYVRLADQNYVPTKGRIITDGKCHHVAVTLGQGSLSIYVDGSPILSRDVGSRSVKSGADWTIGMDLIDPYTTTLEGVVGEVRIDAIALSAEEVGLLAESSQHQDLPAPLAYWPIDTSEDDVYAELSDKKNQAYAQGTSTPPFSTAMCSNTSRCLDDPVDEEVNENSGESLGCQELCECEDDPIFEDEPAECKAECRFAMNQYSCRSELSALISCREARSSICKDSISCQAEKLSLLECTAGLNLEFDCCSLEADECAWGSNSECDCPDAPWETDCQ